MLFTLRDVIVLFSSGLGVLLGVFMLHAPQGRRTASRLMACFFFIQAASFLVTTFLYSRRLSSVGFEYLYYMESALLLAEGAILYWYCKALLFREPSSGRRVAEHASLLGLLFAGAAGLYAAEGIFDGVRADSQTGPLKVGYGYSLLQLTRLAYGVAALLMLRQYLRGVGDTHSRISDDIKWLCWLLFAFVGVRFGWALISIGFAVSLWENQLWLMPLLKALYPLLDVGWLCVYVGLMFFGLVFSPKFESLNRGSSGAVENGVPVNKGGAGNQTACQPEGEADAAAAIVNYQPLLERLERHLSERRSYENPDLKLDELAASVSIPAKTLSVLINRYLGTNFCGLINQYRVQAAARILASEARSREPVLDIALEVGFSSKSTFNRVFKQQMACTPAAYRKQKLYALEAVSS